MTLINGAKGVSRRKLKIGALLIDLDGTLVDSTEAYVEAAKSGFAAIRLDYDDAETALEIARRLELNLPINDVFTEIRVDEAIVDRFLAAYLKAYNAATLTKSKPLPKVFETLRMLSRKLPLALITLRYASKEQVTRELRHLGFVQYFRAIVTALDVKKPKPSPDALLKGAERLDVPIRECAIVGDSIVDIRAGKSARAKTVAVLSGLFTENELERERPDLIIKNINHLPEFLLL